MRITLKFGGSQRKQPIYITAIHTIDHGKNERERQEIGGDLLKMVDVYSRPQLLTAQLLVNVMF
jgi:hypothetical protein